MSVSLDSLNRCAKCWYCETIEIQRSIGIFLWCSRRNAPCEFVDKSNTSIDNDECDYFTVEKPESDYINKEEVDA